MVSKRSFDTAAGGRLLGTNGVPGQSGFTLLELLVSVAIFAFLAAGAYAVLDQALQAQAQADAKLKRLSEVQRAMALLQRDVEQLALRPTRDEYGDPSPLFRADGRDEDRSFFRFTRGGWRNPLGLPRSGLQYLSWRLDQGKLRRDYALYADRTSQTPNRGGVVLTGVVAMKLRMLAAAEGPLAGKGEWREAWPKDELNKKDTSVPRALEVSLELKDMGTLVRVLRLPEVARRDINEGKSK